MHATLNDWIRSDAVPFSIESLQSANPAIDKLIAALNPSVSVLGFGEALHGSQELLFLRNRLFERLVGHHGYSAIAVESSFPRSRLVNEYVLGRGTSYDAIQEAGFSHNFGRLEANRELIEWMRAYNGVPSRAAKIHFYGFDSPTEMMGTDSPSHVLHFALDYLVSVDADRALLRRDRIDALLGSDAEWENPAALMDPSQGIGLSDAANALRIETEDLITHLLIRRPELGAATGTDRYLEALQHASLARQFLTYHAELARQSEERLSVLLGIRDAMMADMVEFIRARERDRRDSGKVLLFAHNRHLQRSTVKWQLGPNNIEWWPAGAQLTKMLGKRYAVIGSGIGASDENGIAEPEAGTLEALLTASSEPTLFIPTHRTDPLPASEIAALPTRSGSTRNSTYMPLGPESLTDFDWLAVLKTSTYNRGGPVLPSGG